MAVYVLSVNLLQYLACDMTCCVLLTAVRTYINRFLLSAYWKTVHVPFLHGPFESFILTNWYLYYLYSAALSFSSLSSSTTCVSVEMPVSDRQLSKSGPHVTPVTSTSRGAVASSTTHTPLINGPSLESVPYFPVKMKLDSKALT